MLEPLPEIRREPRKPQKILDFDIETLAAGFADPNWVPQKITVAAWSWIGSDDVRHLVTGKDGFFNRKIRGRRLLPLLEQIEQADMVTGHNLIRFDLPVLNAECIRCGLPSLKPIKVQDTMRIPRVKGLKKGQDNLADTLGAANKKQSMTWAEWDDAYEEDGWSEAVRRCKTDVIQHKELRAKLLELELLKPPHLWRP